MHTPFEIVQVKTFAPTANPETLVEADDALLKEPEPETKDQTPLPIAGIFANRFAEFEHICWLFPALDELGMASTVIETSSKTLPQEPPGIVQRNTETPETNPVIWVFAAVGEVIDPDPETSVQTPPDTAVAAS